MNGIQLLFFSSTLPRWNFSSYGTHEADLIVDVISVGSLSRIFYFSHSSALVWQKIPQSFQDTKLDFNTMTKYGHGMESILYRHISVIISHSPNNAAYYGVKKINRLLNKWILLQYDYLCWYTLENMCFVSCVTAKRRCSICFGVRRQRLIRCLFSHSGAWYFFITYFRLNGGGTALNVKQHQTTT